MNHSDIFTLHYLDTTHNIMVARFRTPSWPFESMAVQAKRNNARHRRWRAEEDVVDDITAIMVRF